MYLKPYGKTESAQAKKNPLVYQKGSPVEMNNSRNINS
jgi:hypothetical protein